MAFLMRVVACFILAVATVFAIGDIARSLSVHGLQLTSIAEGLAMVSLAGEIAPGSAGASVLALTGSWPAAPTLAAIAFLILLLFGRRRREAADLR